MNWQRRVVGFVLTVTVVLAYSRRPANAQLDVGGYQVFLNSGGGNHDLVGFIDASSRAASASSYTETWYVLPEAIASVDGTLEIFPIQSGRGDDSRRWKDSLEARRIEMQALEHDVAFGALDSGAFLQTLKAIDSDIDLNEIAYMKELWQCAPARLLHGIAEDDCFELVGFIYAPRAHDSTVPNEIWLLSERYIYPSPNNGIRTQLRPLCKEGAPTISTLVEVAARMSIRRHIRVGMRDLDPSTKSKVDFGASNVGCGYGGRAGGGQMLSIIIGAIALIRRSRSRGYRHARK